MRILTFCWKKRVIPSLFLLTLITLLGINTAKAADLPLGKTINTLDGFDYTFVPATAGNLTMDVTNGNLNLGNVKDIVYLNGNGVKPISKDSSSEIVTKVVWALDAGVTYNITIEKYLDERNIVFSFSGESIAPERWTEVSLGQTYTSQPYLLTFSPTSAGKLEVYQEGSAAYALFSDSNCTQAVNPDSMSNLDPPLTYTYNVTPGQTYYFKSSEVTSVRFTFTEDKEPAGNYGTNEGSDIQLNVPFYNPGYSWETMIPAEDYTFIPNFTGTIKVLVNHPGFYGAAGQSCYFFFKSPGEVDNMTIKEVGDSSNPSYPVYLTFDVEANITYYLHWDDEATFLFTVDSEGTTDPDPGPGTTDPDSPDFPNLENAPEGSERMPFNERKTISGIGTNYYWFIAPCDGVLTATQEGSSGFETHLYNDPEHTDPIQGSYPNDSSSPYPVKHSLYAGQVVYYYAKDNSYDAVSAVTFTWTPASTTGMPEMPLDKASVVSGTWKFTAPKTGTLVVRTHNEFFPLENYFLYKDAGHGTKVPLYTTTMIEQGNPDAGRYYYFQVNDGVTYYIYQDNHSGMTYTFTMLDKVMEPQLVSVYPRAGSGFSANAEETTFNLSFAPQEVTIGTVEMSYTDSNGTARTITITNKAFGGGEWHIGLPKFAFKDEEGEPYGITDIKAETDVVYTIHNVMYNGQPITAISEDIAGRSAISTDGNGTFVVKFKSGNPANLTSESWPSPFKAYWYPDGVGKPDAYNQGSYIATLTFDQDLDPTVKPMISVMTGKRTLGSEGAEDDKSWPVSSNNISIEGNTLTIDFSGHKFLSHKSDITVLVSGLYGANGILATYWGDMPYMYSIPFDSSSLDYVPTQIMVNVGEVGDLEWNARGLNLPDNIAFTISDEDRVIIDQMDTKNNFPINLKLEYLGEKAQRPDSHEGVMPDWLWKQMESIEASNHEIDGYYEDPSISGDFADFTEYAWYSMSMMFGCSGRYKLTVSSSDSRFMFNGSTSYEEEFEVYPAIGNTYTYNIEDEQYNSDGLTINGYQMQSNSDGFYINYTKAHLGTEKMANSLLIIPGLYGAKVYYQYDGMPSKQNVRAKAAAAVPAGFVPVSDEGRLDLSGTSPDSSTALNLYIEKNGVGSTNTIFINPSDSITGPTGVEVIGADDAEAEYYDLNGNKMNPGHLGKGIYIVKKGNKATKIVK